MDLWYKSAIFYEISLKSFRDSNGDGIGDFQGLIQKLDYLKDFGIDCIWLLPFYPSPWKDDGYDVSDYVNIHNAFGSMDDFNLLIEECHKRNIKVIADFVINHTSDQHAWFQESRISRASEYRDYYVWSDTNTKYPNTRIIFLDHELSNWTLDPLTNQYYWHRFYSHQPDLNFENEKVQDEVFKILDFWFSKGLDGFRVDAVPYLFEQDGTSSESLPQTHAFIKKLRAYIDRHYPGKILIAEANQMPDETVAYFGNGLDEFHMNFYFPLMPRIFLAMAKKNFRPIRDIIITTSIPDTCQWLFFLRNHDELTLEMVSEEERQFLWHYYAPEQRMRLNLGIRRRLAPLMNNDLRKLQFIKGLLFSLPGTPILYYGDEIGMGDNIQLNDRDGVRTPMQWNSSSNAGFSDGPPDYLHVPVISEGEFNYKDVNVNKQEKDPDSIFNFIKKLIKIRKKYKSLSLGDYRFFESGLDSVMIFNRFIENEEIVTMYNFSDNPTTFKFSHDIYKNKNLTDPFTGESINYGDSEFIEITLGYYEFKWFFIN